MMVLEIWNDERPFCKPLPLWWSVARSQILMVSSALNGRSGRVASKVDDFEVIRIMAVVTGPAFKVPGCQPAYAAKSIVPQIGPLAST